VRRLAARYGEGRLATIGASLLAASLLATALVFDLPAAIVVVTLLAVGQGLLSPLLPALLSLGSGANEQGQALGLGQSLQSAARAAGPILAGVLYDLAPPLPYLLAGVLTLGAAALLVSLHRRATVRHEAEPARSP
jgi:MFS transporter, DHA1 family, tetracycline resistance protein